MPFSGPIGERLAYTAEGDGPPLILLHGFGASSAAFALNISELSRRFSVIAVDLLGHGGSDAPLDPDAYGVTPSIKRIDALLDHFGYASAMFCGHALGGALALRYALERPERVTGVVVLNSTAAVAPESWRATAWRSVLELAERVQEEGTGWLYETRINPANDISLPPAMRARLGIAFQQMEPHALAGTAENLVVDVNPDELLPALEVPVLLVIGDGDTEFAHHAGGFGNRVPQGLVSTITLAGAGHAAQIDDPRGFEAALTGFAERLGYITERRARNFVGTGLVATGAALIVGGIAMLASAALSNPGDSTTPAAASGGLPTQVAGESVAATRTPTQRLSSAVATAPARASTTPSSAATSSATATETPPDDGNAGDEEEDATATPEPSGTPVPTIEPLPTSTPEPTTIPPSPTATAIPGPFASISGPGSADPGQPVTFVNQSGGGALLTQEWTVLGTTANFGGAVTVTFPEAGCYPVSLTAYFADGSVESTGTLISVGGAACQ
ncbi:MAG: alpha/beta fold hydrolase [Tepidiformaceae bacterium]